MTNEDLIENLKWNLIELATAVARGSASGVHCIKAYRAATGAPLKISKDWYDGIAKPKLAPDVDHRLDRLEKVIAQLVPGRAKCFSRSE